jgi:hypothetical protein
MRRHGVAVLAALSGVLATLTVGSALRYAIPYERLAELTSQPTDDPSVFDEYWMEMNALSVFVLVLPWLALAALLAAVAALALAARRAQLAGSASATASRVASSAASVSAGSAESIS